MPIALGADGGGSIRVPSSFCGIYGLKTTHGRVSSEPTVDMASTTGVIGPMTSSIDDLALSYRIMANPDPNNVSSAEFPDPMSDIPTPSSSKNRSKVIGLCKDWINRADPQVLQAFNKAIDYYRGQDYEIIDISIPYLRDGQKAHALTIVSEIASSIKPQQIANLTPPNKILLSISSQASGQDFIAAQKFRNLLMRHLSYLFQKYPGLIIATPTTPMPGWKIARGDADLVNGVSDGNSSLRCMEYVYLANFTGCPAISCPVGYVDGTGVPVGIMGMGEWGSEEALIEWGRDGEGVLGSDTNADVFTSDDNANRAGTNARKGLRTPVKNWVDTIAIAKEA